MESLPHTPPGDDWLKMQIFSVKTTSRARGMGRGEDHSQDFSPELNKAGQSWGETGGWVQGSPGTG